MKSKWFISILVVFIFTACTATYVRHLRILKNEVENTFKSRNELMGKFVALQRDRVTVMTSLLLHEYQSRPLTPPSPLNLQQYPEQGFWQLMPAQPIIGSLTGMSQQLLTPELEHEINAALVLDVQIKPALELDKDVVWLYFLSANQFIYIAPAPQESHFHFTPALYQRSYWVDAGADVNKGRRLMIRGPYEDSAGKGRIITFAQPAYSGDQFLGILGLDLRIATLVQLTNVGAAAGESLLLGADGRVIARQSGHQSELIVPPPLSSKLIDWQKDAAGDLWLSSPVVDNELWLAHRLTRGELYWAVARESAGVWFLVLILSLLALLSLRLRKTLAEVTRLTHVDSLTLALNRRGFYEAAARAISLAQRNQFVLAVLMLDIDHFKKINDTYGHAEGDSVLKQLGGHLNNARRLSDIFCRWGGEEFLLLLLLERAEDALAVAERMRSEAQRTKIQKDDKSITLSGGLVVMEADESIDDAIKRADELLYQAKQTGRNRITYEKMNEKDTNTNAE